ncbi:CHAT domain-containing protein [Streptomyces sp. GF20]|uniref:CHAT domain-containing protein n=1 Tax=Streptomyces sp. GF20 TaxID=2692235 RepID=UPI0013184A1E|nr:CHAT domain-containing protein [Streptomyces sp. GF20]QHC15731.1 CHAT domain-containing protein [Streptomyces sp. GF20]
MPPEPGPQPPGPAFPQTGARAAAEAAYADWVLSGGAAERLDAARDAFRALGDGFHEDGTPVAGSDGPPTPALRAMAGVVRYAAFEAAGEVAQLPPAWHLLDTGRAALEAAGADSAEDEETRRLLRACRVLRWHALCLLLEETPAAVDPAASPDDLTAEALRTAEEVGPLLAEDPGDRYRWHLGQGRLHRLRLTLHTTEETRDRALTHYRAALDTGWEAADRHWTAYLGAEIRALWALLRTTPDPGELRAAAEEMSRFREEHLARSAQGGTPPEPWARDAATYAAQLHVRLWGVAQDPAQAEAAEPYVRASLDGAPDGTHTGLQLGIFGQVLAETGGRRSDPAAVDEGVAVLRRALRRWQPERDGPSLTPAALITGHQFFLYQGDQAPARLHDVALGVRHLLAAEADGAAGPEYAGALAFAAVAGAFCREVLSAQGEFDPENPDHAALPESGEGGILGRLGDAITEGSLPFSTPTALTDLVPGVSRTLSDTGPGDRLMESELARWRALPPGRRRAEVALGHLALRPMVDPAGTRVTPELVREFFACVQAETDASPDDPRWRRRAHGVLAFALYSLDLDGAGQDLDAAMDHVDAASRALDELTARGEAGERERTELDHLRLQIQGHRGRVRGSRDDVAAARALWQDVREGPGIQPWIRTLGEIQRLAEAVQEDLRLHGDQAAADRHLDQLTALVATLPEDHASRPEALQLLESARAMRAAVAGGERSAPATPHDPTVHVSVSERAAALGAVGMTALFDPAVMDDPARAEEARAALAEAHRLSAPGGDRALRFAGALAHAHAVLGFQTTDPAERRRHHRRGVDLLTDALRAAGGPQHRLHPSLGMSLARLLREGPAARPADRARARKAGLDALRGHAWAALLQTGTTDAADVVRDAADAARDVAWWALADGALDDAAVALDAGRGLLLHAATSTGAVPDRLRAAGHAPLADAWEAAAASARPAAAGPHAEPDRRTGVPSALRHKVFDALGAADLPGAHLLDPPNREETGRALRALGRDALVHLVPAGPGSVGHALVVTGRGETHLVPLPRLDADAEVLRAYADATGAPTDTRDLGPAGPARPDTRTLLDRLCHWAWYAGMGPLFDAFAPAGRVPRLVLVPAGRLGLVPWHAAWREEAGGRRYAVERAEFSYTASARLLCETAGRPAGPDTGGGLVVGDPTGDLPYAGQEADAVRRAFYPRARYLGRSALGEPDGTGTPAELLAWLRDPGGDAGGVLHLACHATVRADRNRTAQLLLRGGSLSAEELTDAVAAVPGRLGLVLLAACRSHVSGRGHDEAFSLATAFLVAGARSVVGSLWPVPDEATSVLMYLIHHHLRVDHMPPARALRQAQLWMIGAVPTLPPGLPPELAARARRVDRRDPRNWAAFTHLGH